jgi:parallel beta-helix repeat protein
VGTARALSAAANLAVGGVPDTPAPAATTLPSGGHTYYVDSNAGNDANNGAAAVVGAAGTGPWLTLARLMQAPLAPGDTVVLACGGVWNETLRLPASGSMSQPITVSAPAGGCSTAPAIDGSITLPASAWTLYQGNIYKAALAKAPMQLFAASGNFTQAHHPNAGYLSSNPGSVYLATAAAGNTAGSGGGSTVLLTGPDLVLPAGAAIAPGTSVRIRTGSWLMDETTVSAVNGSQLTLATPTSYSLPAGTGYFLVGQLWMVDSPGEWSYDAAAQQVYAWLPDSAAPSAPVAASTLAYGVMLDGQSNIVLNGLWLRKLGTGVSLRTSHNIALRNSTVEDINDFGVDATKSAGASFDSNSFARIGRDVISGNADNTGSASGMAVRNNLIRDGGVIMSGEQSLSLPKSSRAAILSGTTALVSGNTLVNTGYIGIRSETGSTVQNNFVFGACSVLDDGAGIYTWGSSGVTIAGNTVVHARGALAGKPADQQFTQAQGIYLDLLSTTTTITNNTVIDTDNGLQIHDAYSNQISGNRLYGNRSSQIWLQEDTQQGNANGDVYGNVITGNQIAPVVPSAVGLLLQTQFKSTAAFGSFDNNIYYNRASPVVAAVSIPGTTVLYALGAWQQSSGIGSTQPVDAHGSGVNSQGYATYTVAGSSLLPNMALAQSLLAWTTWNQTGPSGTLTPVACNGGLCLHYTPGGSAGLAISPNFSIVKGQWYRLSLDVQADTAGQIVAPVVRNGGGGSNGYESVSDRSLSFTAGTTLARYSMIFQATESITAHDPVTGSNGARVDLSNLVTGQSLSFGNMELVPITPDPLAQLSGAVLNAGTSALNAACPYASSQPAVCSMFINLANNQALSWPLSVPAYGSSLVYAQNPALVDSDGDGIPDSQDTCPGTPAGAAVNAAGCSINQH